MSNEELLSLFRSVIKEELVPIREEIRGVKLELQAEMKGVKSELQDTRAQMNFRFDTLEMKTSNIDTKLSHVERDVASIKATMDLMSGEIPKMSWGC